MRASLAATAAACAAALSFTLVAPVTATEPIRDISAMPLPPEDLPDEPVDRPASDAEAFGFGADSTDAAGGGAGADAGESVEFETYPLPQDPADIPDLELPADALPEGGLSGEEFTEAEITGFAEAEPQEALAEESGFLDYLEPQAGEATATTGDLASESSEHTNDAGTEDAGSEAVVDHQMTSLPAPRPGAEVYNRPSNGVYRVTGGGFGHGIGMSQYGAHGAGVQGRSHTQILAFYYPSTRLESRNTSSIRVGITVDNDGVTRVANRNGLRVSASPGSTTYALPSGFSQFRVRATGNAASSCVLEGLNSAGSWRAAWPSGMSRACPVTFSSSSEGTVDLFLPSGQQRIYRGSITATHRGSTSLLSVNTVSVQDYLRSVTMAEMPTSFHQQALRAQSVAARTYALSGTRATAQYDVCDTTACQVYRGRGVRNSNGSITAYEHANTDSAVSATNGQVLTYRFANGQQLITAMYSSSTGGHTADAPGVATHGYLRAQPDPYDAVSNNSRNRWTTDLPVSALQSRFGISRVERVQILRRDGQGQWGGRVLSVRVEGFTAGGSYTYVDTTGSGIAAARPWPANATGLSSNFFTFGSGGTTPPANRAERITGGNRYGTAGEVSRAWGSGVNVVYVVSGQDYSDALVAAARTGVFDAPVLLTMHDRIPADTVAALQRLRPQRIVVVGGTGAVNTAVYNQLRRYTTTNTNLTMQRVSGETRYGTAADMASYYSANQQRVYLASGEDYPDALAAAALAAHQGAPLLLARPNQLDSATLAQLRRLNAREVVVVGGTSVVTNAIAEQARSAGTNSTVRRLGGTNRYETMELVARQFPAGAGNAYVASGEDFPDALVGAALAGTRSQPLVLTQPNRVSAPTTRVLQRAAPRSMAVLGGNSAVSHDNLTRLSRFLP